MYFRDLDEAVRIRMVEEIRSDVERGTLYESKRLTSMGLAEWPGMLIRAAQGGTPDTLAGEVRSGGYLLATETSYRNGKPYPKKAPYDAAETLAEGEFNRFYIRAVCVIALDRDQTRVMVYRAKNVKNPRAESIPLVGSTVDARGLLDDLRETNGIDGAFGIPPGPNSGLSVHLMLVEAATAGNDRQAS